MPRHNDVLGHHASGGCDGLDPGLVQRLQVRPDVIRDLHIVMEVKKNLGMVCSFGGREQQHSGRVCKNRRLLPA
jgi:hypothetical protein